MRLAEDEITRLTFADYAALAERWSQRERTATYRLAQVCLVIAKSAGAKDVTLYDFLPESEQPQMGPADMIRMMDGLVEKTAKRKKGKK